MKIVSKNLDERIEAAKSLGCGRNKITEKMLEFARLIDRKSVELEQAIAFLEAEYAGYTRSDGENALSKLVKFFSSDGERISVFSEITNFDFLCRSNPATYNVELIIPLGYIEGDFEVLYEFHSTNGFPHTVGGRLRVTISRETIITEFPTSVAHIAITEGYNGDDYASPFPLDFLPKKMESLDLWHSSFGVLPDGIEVHDLRMGIIPGINPNIPRKIEGKCTIFNCKQDNAVFPIEWLPDEVGTLSIWHSRLESYKDFKTKCKNFEIFTIGSPELGDLPDKVEFGIELRRSYAKKIFEFQGAPSEIGGDFILLQRINFAKFPTRIKGNLFFNFYKMSEIKRLIENTTIDGDLEIRFSEKNEGRINEKAFIKKYKAQVGGSITFEYL